MLNHIYQRSYFSGVKKENYEDAKKHDVWKKALSQKIRKIEKNNMWECVSIPKERKVQSKGDLQNKVQSKRRYSKAQEKGKI